MIRPLLVRTVKFATVHAWLVIGIALLLTLGSGIYVALNFAINTDISKLLESDAPWARNDEAISAAFPQRDKMILAVVQRPKTRKLASSTVVGSMLVLKVTTMAALAGASMRWRAGAIDVTWGGAAWAAAASTVAKSAA